MCNFYNGCIFNADRCKNCCIDNIKNSYKLNRKIINSWVFLYEQYDDMMYKLDEDNNIDTKIYVVSSYTLIPGLFHESIRHLFLEYFKINGIETSVLISGKWLSSHININKKLIESIFITQKISFDEMSFHMDALDFFTKDNQTFHRNKAAHEATEAIHAASRIMLKDVFRKFIAMMHCVVCFEYMLLEIETCHQ